MEEALRAKLLANLALAALTTRISWVTRPDLGTLPAITLTQILPGRNYRMDGWDGLNFSQVQFDHWGDRFSQCVALARATKAAMETEQTHSGWVIGPAFLDSEFHAEPEDVAGRGPVHHIMQEWRLFNAPAS